MVQTWFIFKQRPILTNIIFLYPFLNQIILFLCIIHTQTIQYIISKMKELQKTKLSSFPINNLKESIIRQQLKRSKADLSYSISPKKKRTANTLYQSQQLIRLTNGKITTEQQFIPFLKERDHLGRLIKSKNSNQDRFTIESQESEQLVLSSQPNQNRQRAAMFMSMELQNSGELSPQTPYAQFLTPNPQLMSQQFFPGPTNRGNNDQELKSKQGTSKAHSMYMKPNSWENKEKKVDLKRFSQSKLNPIQQPRLTNNTLRKKMSLDDYKAVISPVKRKNQNQKYFQTPQELNSIPQLKNVNLSKDKIFTLKSVQSSRQNFINTIPTMSRPATQQNQASSLAFKRKYSLSDISRIKSPTKSNISPQARFENLFTKRDTQIQNISPKKMNLKKNSSLKLTEKKRSQYSLPQKPMIKDIDIELNNIKVKFLDCNELERYQRMKNLKMTMKNGFQKDNIQFMNKFQKSKAIIMDMKRVLQG